jgi:hypothetical protein
VSINVEKRTTDLRGSTRIGTRKAGRGFRWASDREKYPQGLKPPISIGFFGTAEAVPLPILHDRKSFRFEAVPLPILHDRKSFRFEAVPLPILHDRRSFRCEAVPLPILHDRRSFRFEAVPLPILHDRKCFRCEAVPLPILHDRKCFRCEAVPLLMIGFFGTAEAVPLPIYLRKAH